MTKSRAHLLTGYMLICVGIGLAVYVLLLNVHGHSSQPIAPGDTTATVHSPSSTKPTVATIDSYIVAPTLPKYIAITHANVTKARIVQLGLQADSQIATPDNIYDTGWYTGSSKPGQPGTMFIYGHVSSWQANGVFYNLKNLTSGDEITITRGDNQTFTYRVAKMKIYPYNQVDMRAVLSPIDPSRPGLSLMTCTGHVIKGTSEFDERLVVFASLSN